MLTFSPLSVLTTFEKVAMKSDTAKDLTSKDEVRQGETRIRQPIVHVDAEKGLEAIEKLIQSKKSGNQDRAANRTNSDDQ
jgi:hypothetical protein